MRRTSLAISTAVRDWGRSLEAAAPPRPPATHAPLACVSTAGDRDPPSGGAPPADPTRSATDLVWPMTRRQQKFASRVSRALANVLTRDAALHEELVVGAGVAVKSVRVSPDHAKAFVLWDSVTGQAAAAERALGRATPRLRAALARALAARAVPRLEFRHDAVAEAEQELEGIFTRLEAERKGEGGEGG